MVLWYCVCSCDCYGCVYVRIVMLCTLFHLVPIIDVVKSEALSLLNISINITLLTTGGQNVTEFNVSKKKQSISFFPNNVAVFDLRNCYNTMYFVLPTCDELYSVTDYFSDHN